MTLLMTSLTARSVVQVSDVRLTISVGADVRIKDAARKMIFYDRGPVRMVVGYTGLAEFRDAERREAVSTENWLVQTLTTSPSLDETTQRLPQLLDGITKATRQWFHLGDGGDRLTVVLVGFDSSDAEPVVVAFSNFEEIGTRISSSQLEQFEPVAGEKLAASGAFGAYRFRAAEPCILVHGDRGRMTRDHAKALRRQIRDVQTRQLGSIAERDLLVSTMKECGSEGHGTVSQDCWSYVHELGATIANFDFHAGNTQAIHVAPQVILASATAQMFISSDTPTDEEERLVESIRSGDTNMLIDAASLKAYARTSPYADDLARVELDTGVRVEVESPLPHIVDCFGVAGLKTITDLDNALRRAQNWSIEFLHEYRRAWDAKYGRGRLSSVSVGRVTILALVVQAERPDIFTSPSVVRRLLYPMTHAQMVAAAARAARSER